MKLFRKILSLVALATLIAACEESNEIDNTPPQSEGRITLEVDSESSLFSSNESGSTIGFKSRGGELALDVVTNAESWSYDIEGGEIGSKALPMTTSSM
ncbi:MAG: hypothetical protein UHY58_07080 [Alistipes sp.]|nr:hypothetical protein [Alistipes sp.]